jgi:hypothetical protein
MPYIDRITISMPGVRRFDVGATVRIVPSAAARVAAISSQSTSGTTLAQAAVPTVETSKEKTTPDWKVVVGSVVFLAVAAAVVLGLTRNYPYSATATAPVAGLTIFAVYFVAAQAIERLLEPVASFFGQTPADDLDSATATAQSKVDEAHVVASASGSSSDQKREANDAATAALKEAATKKAKKASSQADRAIAFWALASAVGIAASAFLKLYLLTTVGVASPGRILDVIATGLIIGAGTKPLHDLVTLISAQKTAAKSAA